MEFSPLTSMTTFKHKGMKKQLWHQGFIPIQIKKNTTLASTRMQGRLASKSLTWEMEQKQHEDDERSTHLKVDLERGSRTSHQDRAMKRRKFRNYLEFPNIPTSIQWSRSRAIKMKDSKLERWSTSWDEFPSMKKDKWKWSNQIRWCNLGICPTIDIHQRAIWNVKHQEILLNRKQMWWVTGSKLGWRQLTFIHQLRPICPSSMNLIYSKMEQVTHVTPSKIAYLT